MVLHRQLRLVTGHRCLPNHLRRRQVDLALPLQQQVDESSFNSMLLESMASSTSQPSYAASHSHDPSLNRPKHDRQPTKTPPFTIYLTSRTMITRNPTACLVSSKRWVTCILSHSRPAMIPASHAYDEAVPSNTNLQWQARSWRSRRPKTRRSSRGGNYAALARVAKVGVGLWRCGVPGSTQ